MIDVIIIVIGIVIIFSYVLLKFMYTLGNNYDLSDSIFGNSGLPGTKGYGKHEKMKTNKKWNQDGSLQ